MNKIIKNILIYAVLIFLGVGIGYFLGFTQERGVLNKKLSTIRPLRENNSAYKFIDPLLAYILPSAEQEAGLSALKNKIDNFVNSNKRGNNLSDASVFFYELNKGRWVGVNEFKKYSPASMLKVVIMVAYLKDSEQNQGLLNKYLTYTKEIDDFVKSDPLNTLSSLKIGNSYKAEDLINKMIIDSDNGAEYLLLANINQESLDSIYSALDIENPNGKNDFVISPRTYSLFLRILYSATYLGKENSEKALDILSKTTYVNGLIAGVPKDIIVAHKFGERVTLQNNQAQQIELHDCGIVYYSENPYLLCVMTKGNNLSNLENIIKGISSLVYQDRVNF